MSNQIEKLKGCIFDKNFGKKIKNETLGNSFKFFFVFMFFISILIMAKFSVAVNLIMDQAVSKLNSEYSNFEVKNGKFIYYGEMPVLKVEDDIAVVIDTTGTTDETTLKRYSAGVFINENKVIFKKNEFDKRIYDLEDFKDTDFTKKDLVDGIKSVKIPFIIICFILGVIFIYILKLIGILFVTIIGLIFNRTSNRKLKYVDIFKISIYAVVLPSIIKVIITSAELQIPFFFSIYYLITGFYILRYLKSYNNDVEIEIEKM